MREKLKILNEKLQRSIVRHFKIWVGGCVVLVLFLVGWFLTREADVGTRQAAEELVRLSENIRRYYQNRPDYWGLSTQTVLSNRIYPQSMLQNGELRGFFGNEVLVGRGENAEVLMPGARGFDIIYKHLNKKQCQELASFKFNEKFWLGIAGITLSNGRKQQFFTWSDKEHILPIKPAAAKALCSNDNLLIWHHE